MRKNRVKIMIFLLFLITIASGIITFFIANKRNINSGDNVPENSIKETLELKKAEAVMASFDLNEIFDKASTIYLEHSSLPSYLVEIEGTEKSIIAAYFKSLPKVKSSLIETGKNIIDKNTYRHQISILDSNIKIKIFDESGYILIEDKENMEWYSVNNEKLKDFVMEVERIYIDKQLEKVFGPEPTRIHITARDENSVYFLGKKEIEELYEKLNITSIEKNSDFVDTPSQYPDYYISSREGDKEYYLRLLNEEVMILETPMVYIYCKYDRKLWDFVKEKLSFDLNVDKNDIKYLFKSDSVSVIDLTGEYDVDSSTYYNVMIPRYIMRAGYEEINSEQLTDNDLRYVLDFQIDGGEEKVLIYNNYIVYRDAVYFSKGISEVIKTLLMMP